MYLKNGVFKKNYIPGSHGILTARKDLLWPNKPASDTEPYEPYLWYHLNESSGPTVADASTNGRDGTASNHTWVSGKLNNGLSCNGTTTEIDCGDVAHFERTDSWSTEFWYKPAASVKQNIFCNQQSSGNYRGWRNVVRADGYLQFELISAGGNTLQVTSSLHKLQTTTSWYHAVITYDGTSAPSGIKFYIDAFLQPNSTILNTLTGTIVEPTENLFMCRYDGIGETTNGIVDEAVIYYNKVLTQAEVDFRYNGGSGTETMI